MRDTHAASQDGLSVELASQLCRSLQLGLEFLGTELQMAEAFLNLAETSRNPTASRQNLRNTVTALDAVTRFIERLNGELLQRQRLARRATELGQRLATTELRLQSRGHPEESNSDAGRGEDPHGR